MARRRRWLPWALCWLALAAGAAGVVLEVLDRARLSFESAQPQGIVMSVSFSLLGALIVSRQPWNRIGWIYLGIGLLMPLQSLTSLYYQRSVLAGGLPGGKWAAWASTWISLPVFPTGLALFAFLLFPSGQLPGPGWRKLGWLAGVVAAATLVTTLLAPGTMQVAPGYRPIANPTGVSTLGSSLNVVSGLLLLLGLALIAGTIASLVVRSRRAAPRERQQIKLLAYAAMLTIGSLVALTVAGFLGAEVENLWNVPVVFGFGVAVPAACGIAILRYGLYEIDRLISRTISYALLTGLLVGLFVGLVLLTTRVLTFSSPVGVAASTLLAAGLFSPLRGRLQRLVDRRFNRARYDAEAAVAAFGSRLRDAVDPETVLSELAAAAGSSLQPAHVSVWVKS